MKCQAFLMCLLASMALLTACGEPQPERRLSLRLHEAIVVEPGEHHDVEVLLARGGDLQLRGFAAARRWNAATYPVDITDLAWSSEDVLTGRIVVEVLPDAWVPRDRRARTLEVMLQAAPGEEGLAGTYRGFYDGQEVHGRVSGRLGAPPALAAEPKAGLLRVFVPAEEGDWSELTLRFAQQGNTLRRLSGPAAASRDVAMRIDDSGMAGDCVLLIGGQEPLHARMELVFVGDRIGGVAHLTRDDQTRTASLAGTLELVSDGNLATHAEEIPPLSDERRGRIAEARRRTADLEDRFGRHVHERGGAEQPYRLFTPDVPGGQRVPLVVFLHGAGERGTDNERHLNDWVKTFATSAIQDRYPAFVLAPQASNWYGGRPVGAPEDSPRIADLIVDIVRELITRPDVDPDRVYVTGLSMGGYGTCEVIRLAPDLFAAGMPVCGAIPEAAEALRGIPLWIFHGDADHTVVPGVSRALVKNLRALGANPRYTEYPDVGHGSFQWAYTDPATFEWLFAQRRAPRQP